MASKGCLGLFKLVFLPCVCWRGNDRRCDWALVWWKRLRVRRQLCILAGLGALGGLDVKIARIDFLRQVVVSLRGWDERVNGWIDTKSWLLQSLQSLQSLCCELSLEMLTLEMLTPYNHNDDGHDDQENNNEYYHYHNCIPCRRR